MARAHPGAAGRFSALRTSRGVSGDTDDHGHAVVQLTNARHCQQILGSSYHHAESPVLFHITQVHTPETCPRDSGGSNSLFNANVPGLKLLGRYGANAQHTMFYVVEADNVDAIHKFLWPGFTRCTATITPVSLVPVPKD